MPGYIEWLLSFPRAPWGSVSIQVWGTACATVIHLVGAAVAAAWVLAQTRAEGRQKIKLSAGKRDAKEKKEL